jgi:transposase-like protein
VIAVAVRWHLRYGLSYRDVEGLPAERGVHVDHVDHVTAYGGCTGSHGCCSDGW